MAVPGRRAPMAVALALRKRLLRTRGHQRTLRRWRARSGVFLGVALLGISAVVLLARPSPPTESYEATLSGSAAGQHARRLYTENNPDCNAGGDDPNSSYPVGVPPSGKSLCDGEEWKLVYFVLLMMYMFWALAIIVDEFFVPALDVLSDACGFSPDVAGATLMAAGGSAPEFFTSLFSAVQDPPSATGFGTIVGSAVFNVLFVIAFCALFSKETLVLTWWPLLRDCSFYAVSLALLAIFFKTGGGDGTITAWEAAVLFGMYILYVVLMKNNERLHAWVDTKMPTAAVAKKGSDVVAADASPDDIELEEVVSLENGTVAESKSKRMSVWNVDVDPENMLFVKPSKFRAGVLQIAMTSSNVTAAGIAAVAKIKGNVYDTAAQFDKNQDGKIDEDEMKELLARLHCPNTDADVAVAMKEIDTDGNGEISLEEFAVWYAQSEALLVAEMRDTFKRFDANGDGTISQEEIRAVLQELSPDDELTLKELQAATGEIKAKDPEMITSSEFERWYVESMFWTEARRKQEEDTEAAEPLSIFPPPGGVQGNLVWAISLPLTLPLFLTVPSTRRKAFNTLPWALLAFAASILWIALYSWLMVISAETFGKTLGIPDVVMGVTILAAGTSIPDLLSSVIVARQGFGDMAVSSSIGSNIFDILVGLPIPWLISIASKGKNVEVGSDGLAISIVILLCMLVSVVVIIKINGWKLTKSLAGAMLILYVAYVAQELARADFS